MQAQQTFNSPELVVLRCAVCAGLVVLCLCGCGCVDVLVLGVCMYVCMYVQYSICLLC